MDDIYCQQIIPGHLKVSIIFETELVMAFYHTQPYWEHHAVIIPKKHIISLSEYKSDDVLNKDLFEAMTHVTQLFEREHGGCRISSNTGSYQTSKHLHWYVHAGKRIKMEPE